MCFCRLKIQVCLPTNRMKSFYCGYVRGHHNIERSEIVDELIARGSSSPPIGIGFFLKHQGESNKRMVKFKTTVDTNLYRTNPSQS